MWVCTGRSEALDPLELESEAVVSHPTWMLGIKLSSSARVVSTLTAKPSLHHHHRHLLPLDYQTITLTPSTTTIATITSPLRCCPHSSLSPWLGTQVATSCGGNYPLEFLFVLRAWLCCQMHPQPVPIVTQHLGKCWCHLETTSEATCCPIPDLNYLVGCRGL